MSYCRWSNNDFQCDVYCYADVDGGYTTHVAAGRPVFDGPLPPAVPFDKDHVEEFVERHKKVMEMVEKAVVKRIGLEYDDATFNDATAGEEADRLQMLKDAGYNVPQYAIDALREEAGEEDE